jgi:hypothetical protein
LSTLNINSYFVAKLSAGFLNGIDNNLMESFKAKNNMVSSSDSNKRQSGKIERVVAFRRRFTPAPTILRRTNRIIAMLYSNRISDFFPTYLTPSGIAIIIAARNENPRNHSRNRRSSSPRKIGINARNGSVVTKDKESVSVFP